MTLQSHSGLSLRGFAKLVGVSPEAVSKAVKRGRLVRSISTVDGRPVIVDATLAREEWAVRAGRRPPATRGAERPVQAQGAPVVAPERLVDVQQRIALQRERKLRRDNDEREGRLVPVTEVERVQAAAAVAVKSQLLAVPHRAVLDGLPPEHAPLVRRLIVDALRELAGLRTMAALDAAEDLAS